MAHQPSRYTAAGRLGGRLPDADIVRLYAELGSCDAVALRARCSNQTVRTILHACGVAVRPRGGRRRTFALPAAAMVALHAGGLSLARIAERAGCAPSTVRNVIKRAQDARRPNNNEGEPHDDAEPADPDAA